MGTHATKASGNPWYEARIKAAKTDRRLRSREGAAELLNMSVSAVADAELDLSKVMPVDKAVQMAELYNAPQLLNWYCLHECPIQRGDILSCETVSLERVTVKLVQALRADRLEALKNLLMDIAQDGRITKEEYTSMEEIVRHLDSLCRTASELKILWQTQLGEDRQRNRYHGYKAAVCHGAAVGAVPVRAGSGAG